MKKYVTLCGALWELDHDRYLEVLECVAQNKPYNLLDFGIQVGVVNLDLEHLTRERAAKILNHERIRA